MVDLLVEHKETIDLGTRELTPEGIVAVQNKIYDMTGVYLSPSTIGFEYVNQEGKVTRRVKNILYKEHGVKAPNELLQAIGNIAHQHTTSKEKYTFDFTYDLDSWRGGDFCDGGSCFWTFNAYHRLAMNQDRRFFAVRFFKDDGRGAGRCWGFHYKNGIVLFNAYGLYDDEIAKVIAAYMNQPKHEVLLSSNVYINGDAWYIGPDTSISHVRVLVDMDTVGNVHLCAHCNTILNLDWDEWNMIADELFCLDCTTELFTFCDVCEEFYENEDVYPVQNDPENRRVCRYCVDYEDETFAQCDDCGKVYLIEDVAQDLDVTLCRDCSPVQCKNCGRGMLESDPAFIPIEHGNIFCSQACYHRHQENHGQLRLLIDTFQPLKMDCNV